MKNTPVYINNCPFGLAGSEVFRQLEIFIEESCKSMQDLLSFRGMITLSDATFVTVVSFHRFLDFSTKEVPWLRNHKQLTKQPRVFGSQAGTWTHD